MPVEQFLEKSNQPECIFCSIASGKSQSYKVDENEKIRAIIYDDPDNTFKLEMMEKYLEDNGIKTITIEGSEYIQKQLLYFLLYNTTTTTTNIGTELLKCIVHNINEIVI